jgi:hypothetical protein
MNSAAWRWLAAVLAASALGPAFAWGPDGHSIVAEIAERRLSAATRAQVEALLGRGHSLASEGSWADDVRPARPETFNWHFVDIPLDEKAYDAARDCPATPKGDCIVAELARVREQLRCGDVATRREALRWAVHLVGDLHQPLHTVAEQQGGNGVKVETELLGLRCPRCTPRRTQDNLHWVWDTSIITATTWNWGAYVSRLEGGWLASADARDAARGTVIDWTHESHAVAREIWPLTPADHVIRDDYYFKALPVVDRQLGRAGVRLAAFLDDAFLAACAAR